MTTAAYERSRDRDAWPPAELPRLLPSQPEDLSGHLARFGPVPYTGTAGALIPRVEASGLTGRGGAAFPVRRKLAIVAAARGRKVVVANGAESEPASRKDEVLLQVAPHLVLDGLQLAAEAVGASEARLHLHRGAGSGIGRVLAGRRAAGLDRLEVTITETPARFLAGQESAVVNRIGGGPALPLFTPPRVTERGLHGQPTLVQNVETLAHLALIARYGPRWFRAIGTAAEPGSMLTTLYPAGGGCRVAEAAIGTARGMRASRSNRLPRQLAAAAGLGRPHAGQRVAATVRRRSRRGRAGRAAITSLRPDRDRPGRHLPGGGVRRPVRAVPEWAAPHRRRPSRAGRAPASPADPRRPRALGRAGRRPGSM